jgi:6-phosphofructokinase 1
MEMSSLRRVGILTGGGDVPGLNSCIRAFTLRALDEGIEVLGIRRGWGGLLEIDPSGIDSTSRLDAIPSILRLERETVRTVGRHGGTFLHTSRTNPASVKRSELPDVLRTSLPEDAAAAKEKVDVTAHVLRVLNALGLDALVAIGGDDTLSYAVRLDREGFPVIAIPKTMDNDVPGTDYCIGFSTAVTRSVDFLHQLRTPAGSHERIAVLELFGRYCGETALFTGHLGDADRTVISEVPFDIDRLAGFLTEDQDSNPSHYAVLVISEGAVMTGGDRIASGEPDAYGHRRLGGIGDVVGVEIERRTGRQTLVQRFAYLMRSGPPDSLDRLVATNFGTLAYDRLVSGRRGEMVALQRGRYTVVPVATVLSGKRQVDVASHYDSQAYRPHLTEVLDLPMFLT